MLEDANVMTAEKSLPRAGSSGRQDGRRRSVDMAQYTHKDTNEIIIKLPDGPSAIENAYTNHYVLRTKRKTAELADKTPD